MKKIFSMFLGIVFALVSLEVLLQVSSFVITQTYKINNNRSVKIFDDKEEIKILCVGESTTFAQYPKQLVDYLNRKINKDFIVIDCGVPGTNVENITDRIDEQIKMYNPDIVVSMMGANDAKLKETRIYKKYKFKTVGLFMLIKRHIESIAAEKLYADANNTDYSKLVDSYFQTGNQPIQLIKIVNNNPNNIKATEALVSIYRMRKDYSNVEKYAGKFLTTNPSVTDMFILFMLTDVYIQQKKYNLADNLILSILISDKINEEQKNEYLSKVVESYISFSTIDELTRYYNLLVDNKIQTIILDDLYKYLKKNKASVKYYTYANRYSKIGQVPDFDTEEIKKSYLLFAQKLIDKNIVYICMGYPTISIETFRNFFKNTKLNDKIVFISNENNFKEKLETMPYYELFVDNFGGTFGHCTNFGNTLIAENVGKKIIEIVN
ncbi:MAG: SGNH/GDSL hydrolase family protein [Endomicrobiia bacterium]